MTKKIRSNPSAAVMPVRIRRRLKCRGAQIVEMAITFSVLLFLSFGLVEFGQYFYIIHCFESAVRDGARYAILATATQAQTATTISSTLMAANVTYNSNWLTITDLTTNTSVTDVSQVPAGDQMQFTLSTTYGNIPNAVRPLYSITGVGIAPTKAITSTCVMVKE